MSKRGGISQTSAYYMLLVPIIIIILILGAYLYFTNSTITGLSQYEDTEDFYKDLNLRFETSSTFNFDLGRVPTALQLAGSFEEGTVARVYYVNEGNKFLILNTESLENEFDYTCADTCEIETFNENVILSVEVDSGVLILNKLKYSALVSTGNNPPEWRGRTSFYVDGITTYEINLENFFYDADKDPLTYSIRSRENPFSAYIYGKILRITTNARSGGTHSIRVIASDKKDTTDVSLQINVLGLEEYAPKTTAFDPAKLTYTESCRAIEEDGKTIVLKGNAKSSTGSCFTINADNVVFDCAQKIIYANEGITVRGDNVEIKNCKIYSRANGVTVSDSSNLYLHDNKIYNNDGAGVMLQNIFSGRIISNVLENNMFGIRLLTSNGYNEIMSNTFTKNRASGLFVGESSQAVIAKNIFDDNLMYGISLFSSSNNLLQENTVSGSENGMSIAAESRNNDLISNDIEATKGIYFENSQYNSIRSNKIKGGIEYDDASILNAELDNVRIN
ncbi:right-handed parallel beta-helix repeat-containing protein [Candidatus Woesearchaeota archaeon]|nr:right-handed parallel beta-helix repeat-containing protein [Candidatus Woesearchaeota archaeon]